MNQFWARVAGHKQVVEQLRQLLSRGTVPHAMLFCGPEAVGKRLVAQALASSLLTSNGKDAATEEKLRLLAAGNHPDYHVCSREEEKKDISVDAIRELCGAIRLKPYYATCSVSIINDAHEMSLAASNAMLTTLEEPNGESYLILVTHAPQRLPATILSRCQTVHFGELTQDEIAGILERELKIDTAARAKLLELCPGSLEVLEIADFVDPMTLQVKDAAELETHLAEIRQRVEKLSRDIDGYIKLCVDQSLTASAAVSFASQLAADASDTPIMWKLLHRTLQKALRTARRSDIARLANLLELSLAAEKLVRERNVNPQLQLTSLLLEELR